MNIAPHIKHRKANSINPYVVEVRRVGYPYVYKKFKTLKEAKEFSKKFPPKRMEWKNPPKRKQCLVCHKTKSVKVFKFTRRKVNGIIKIWYDNKCKECFNKEELQKKKNLNPKELKKFLKIKNEWAKNKYKINSKDPKWMAKQRKYANKLYKEVIAPELIQKRNPESPLYDKKWHEKEKKRARKTWGKLTWWQKHKIYLRRGEIIRNDPVEKLFINKKSQIKEELFYDIPKGSDVFLGRIFSEQKRKDFKKELKKIILTPYSWKDSVVPIEKYKTGRYEGDHIIPIAYWKKLYKETRDLKYIIMCFNIRNIQLLPSHENRMKMDYVDEVKLKKYLNWWKRHQDYMDKLVRDILDKDNEKILKDTMPIQWFGKTFHRNKSLS
jgi:hypothetical protein|tara:strand:- start:83 stop:1225 length:1143 start_codon:yes stop_codon:yes gene_type:complete